MSPLTLKRIKEAKGNVRVKSDNSDWVVQILEDNTWKTIYKNKERTVCEEAVTKASQQVILG